MLSRDVDGVIPTAMAGPAKRRGVDRSHAIYLALRQAIIEQALEPGVKLPEDAIGERFGVSRTIVRHALGRLASDGLAELRPNRGAAVAKPSWEEARDVYEVRISIERMVMKRLAGVLSQAQAARLTAHVEDEEQARGSSEQRSIRLATEFHILLAEMTGSSTLSQYVSQLASRCGLILALHGRPHSSDCAVSEHRDIIAALSTGDQAKAVEVMDRHLRAVAGRALIAEEPNATRDIRDILAPYIEGQRSGKPLDGRSGVIAADGATARRPMDERAPRRKA
jgi:DNA-binding GntR family transcriptional regulator